MKTNRVHVRTKMIDFILTFILTLALAVLATGTCACGPLKSPFSNGEPERETIFALDGVKLISTSISRGDDPSTFGQKTYSISSGDRLLLRFESLNASLKKINSAKPVRIRVFATSETERAKAFVSLRLCPILQNWMMAATWRTAHPFKEGEWTPGGAIEPEECVPADSDAGAGVTTGTGTSKPDPASINPTPTHNPCAEQGVLCFDVSAWYQNYVLQRGTNFGLALISINDQIIQVYVDGPGSKAPRIHWVESSGVSR